MHRRPSHLWVLQGKKARRLLSGRGARWLKILALLTSAGVLAGAVFGIVRVRPPGPGRGPPSICATWVPPAGPAFSWPKHLGPWHPPCSAGCVTGTTAAHAGGPEAHRPWTDRGWRSHRLCQWRGGASFFEVCGVAAL